MSRLRFSITVSIDGFVAGPNQSLDEPLGKGGEELHEWAFALEAWRSAHGRDGGEVNESSAAIDFARENVGATIMGRKMFGGGPGPWGDEPWPGWWGDDPPYHHPVFVLTNHPRETLAKEGGNSFTFVTDGIESALEQAKAAAAGKDVHLAGGANVAQQYLRAGLVDEMLLSVVPHLLGGGERLLDNLDTGVFAYECVAAVAAPGVTHLTYTKK